MIHESFQPIPHIDTTSEKDAPIPTGAAVSSRFPIASAANQDIYSPSKKSLPKKKESIVHESDYQNPLYSPYTHIALTEDNGLEKATKQFRHDHPLKFLKSTQILTEQPDGSYIVDKERLRSQALRKWDNPGNVSWSWGPSKAVRVKYKLAEEYRVNMRGEDFFESFLQTKARASEQPEMIIPITALPESIVSLSTVEYPPCHLKPWEIKAFPHGSQDLITLKDGTQTSLLEIEIAHTLHALDIKRDKQKHLTIVDPKDNQRKRLTGDLLRNLGGMNFLVTEGDKKTTFASSPASFTQRFLKNLTALDIIRPSDFPKFSSDFESTPVAPRDRKINPKSAHISLQTPRGKSVGYYIGRNKIIGTDIPLNPEQMVVRYLDNQTCGIVRVEANREEILSTFSLLTPEEIEVKRFEVQRRYQEKHGKPMEQTSIAASSLLSAEEMSTRVRQYQVTDYIPIQNGENTKDYANRVARLSDAKAISSAREFFQQFNIGLHQLPWEEQIGASSILIDPRISQNSLVPFCQQFGIDGLRTFVSSTFGDNVNQKILALGEKSPDIAKQVFQKYGEILSAASDAENTLRLFKDQDPKKYTGQESLLHSIKNNLLTRAKTLLEQIADNIISNKKSLSPNKQSEIELQLSQIKTDIEITRNVIRALRENGELASLSELKGFESASMPGPDVPESLRGEMRIFYDKNYSLENGYSETFRLKLFRGLELAFQNPQTTFHTVAKDEKIISYLRFDNEGVTPDGREKLYFGSFNMDPEFQGAKIGETFLEELLKKKAETAIIEAYADPVVPVSEHYIEKDGFIATGIEMIGDRPLLKIIYDAKLRDTLKSKTAISLATDAEVLDRVKAQSIHKVTIRKGELPNFSEQFEGGFLLTRILRTRNDTLYIFEQPLTDTEEESIREAA